MRNLLLIDDDEVDRLAIRRAIASHEPAVRIAEASTGREGVRRVRRERFDCILLDFNLPDRDGLACLTEINALGRRAAAPVVMLTGEGTEKIAAAAFKHGASDYVVKDAGLSGRMLRKTVAAAMERWALILAKEEAEETLRLRNAELEAARRDAVRASAAKSEFLAAMSHDLRTPLNAIMGFSEIMRSELFGPVGDARYREYVDAIFQSGAYLKDIVDDVLDLARVENGKVKTNWACVAVGEVLEFCARQAEARMASLDSRLVLEPPNPSLTVYGDRRMIAQVIDNVLTNAVRFARTTVRVGAERQAPDAGDVVICIEDDGPGMTACDIDVARKPFEQVSGQYAYRREGVGLGLYLCEKYLGIMGGELAIRSDVNRGTAVRIRLPGEGGDGPQSAQERDGAP